MSAKRTRGTPFPQGNSENLKRRAWWTRGNAFKVAAAFRPVLESLDGAWFIWDDNRQDESMRGIVEFLALTGDGNLGLRPSKSRLSFYSQQSVINLISLEVDRYTAQSAFVDEQMEFWFNDESFLPSDFFSRYQPVRAYEDAFVSRRDISVFGLYWIWSRILLDWYGARLPGAFIQNNLPNTQPPRNQILAPQSFTSARKKQGDGSRLAPPRVALSGEAQLQQMEDLHDRMRGIR